MRGFAFFQFPIFHAAAKRLREQGHEVFSPAEHDEANDYRPVQVSDRHLPLAHFMEHDLPEVCRADTVAVLPRWHDSEGARLEVYVGRICGKQILDALTLEPVSRVMNAECTEAADQIDRCLELDLPVLCYRALLQSAARLLREVEDN